MSDNTEKLIRDLDISSYRWGFNHGSGDYTNNATHKRDALYSRLELSHRFAKLERSRDTWQERAEADRRNAENAATEREEMRVTLMNERNQRDGAETRRDLLAAEVTLEKARAESAEARVEELTEENARLEQEVTVAELRKSPAEQEIKLLVDERATLEAEARRLHGRVKSLTHNVDHQKERIVKLTEERDDLRAENERLRGELGLWQARSNAVSDQLANLRTAVPRVIRPDEVREGQVVAVRIETVSYGPEWHVYEPDEFFSADGLIPAPDTYVLLDESPEDADEEERPRIQMQNVTMDFNPAPELKASLRRRTCDCGCEATG